MVRFTGDKDVADEKLLVSCHRIEEILEAIFP